MAENNENKKYTMAEVAMEYAKATEKIQRFFEDFKIAQERRVIMPYKGNYNCPNCSTYNETWRKREKTVKGDIVFCWHCGQRVRLKSGKLKGSKSAVYIDDFANAGKITK